MKRFDTNTTFAFVVNTARLQSFILYILSEITLFSEWHIFEFL